MQGAISVGVEVIASTSEYYLVNTGITPVPIMLTSNDGSQYQSEIDMVSYSLIKKDDYLSNTLLIFRLQTNLPHSISHPIK